MTPRKDNGRVLSDKWQNPLTPMPLIVIPQRISSLPRVPLPPSPPSSVDNLEDLVERTQALEISKSGLELSNKSSVVRRPLLTPPNTPSTSKDRFISSRRQGNDAVDYFRANRPWTQLTTAQKQMRMNGDEPDPFMSRRTRRVTPRESDNEPRPRIPSASHIWAIGGSIPHHNPIIGVDAGRGVTLGSGTNARLFQAEFYERPTVQESSDLYDARLALALELDRSAKVLDFNPGSNLYKSPSKPAGWANGIWTSKNIRSVLDAPSLRDDFYCTLIAYCTVFDHLAVGLKNRVYLWSQSEAVQRNIENEYGDGNCHVTSLSFSSPGGRKGILAIGRNDGRLSLWHPTESRRRLAYHLSKQVSCLAFKPTPSTKFPGLMEASSSAEELLVGDDAGNVYYFSVKWPLVERIGRSTTLTLLAKLCFHKQQVCGLAWSPDGEYFATGANDNLCFLAATKDILDVPYQRHIARTSRSLSTHSPVFVSNRNSRPTVSTDNYSSGSEICSTHSIDHHQLQTTSLPWPIWYGPDGARHCWRHGAAVKAIAFCPWQKGLVATAGGSTDRAIHFFHTRSGACLATIEVYAQVTSLIWSKTKREICATFGFSQPEPEEHPYRIAVFSWPECKQILRIPWQGTTRALSAIAYPGGPSRDSEGKTWWPRTKEEGCIAVVASDESVKFHEVWSGHSSSIGTKIGGLAWSSILESLEGDDIGVGSSEIIR